MNSRKLAITGFLLSLTGRHFQQDNFAKRTSVSPLMIEINRGTYMNENTSEKSASSDNIKVIISELPNQLEPVKVSQLIESSHLMNAGF